MSSQNTKSIIIYGKGKAMQSMCDLLDYLDIAYLQMDDQDADDAQIKKSKKIIATPGIKPSHRLYTTYSKKIVSELSFLGKLIKDGYFPRRNNLTTIGITGTNGKSTTTRALYQACQTLTAGQEDLHVYAGGNFDVPLSGLILRILKEEITTHRHLIVLECSSFMLWKLANFTFDIGILLNIAPDHIDRHGSMREYLQSKINILIHSKVAITNDEIKENVLKDQMRGISLLHRLRPFGVQNSPYRWLVYRPLTNFFNPLFLGNHNASNFGAVDSALQSLYGIAYDRVVLNTVKPVAHRLSPIELRDGITIIDDSVSSSSHALCAAVDAMQSPCVLVAGGYDNGEQYHDLSDKIDSKVAVAIFYGQTRAILYPLAKQLIADVYMVETLGEALRQAIEECKKTSLTTILYSPGAKSFDQFDNVYHRIRVFEEEITKMR